MIRLCCLCLVSIWLTLPASAQAYNSGVQRLFGVRLINSEDKRISLNELRNHSASILVFMSPDCPISQKYSRTLRQLDSTYRSQGIAIYGIVPMADIPAKELRQFAADYAIPFPVLLDKKKKTPRILNARITPEVFLLDQSGNILYQGQIDNWFNALGKYRPAPTEHYLIDALDAFVQGKEIAVKKTDAIGCFIPD
jgi:peroxiredoxin